MIRGIGANSSKRLEPKHLFGFAGGLFEFDEVAVTAPGVPCGAGGEMVPVHGFECHLFGFHLGGFAGALMLPGHQWFGHFPVSNDFAVAQHHKRHGAADRPLLQIEDLHKRFGELEVLCGVDLEVKRGEKVSIIGPSGSGKSTMLNLIAGWLVYSPPGGSAEALEQDLAGLQAQVKQAKTRMEETKQHAMAVEKGRMVNLNFDKYEILRLADYPKVETVIVNTGEGLKTLDVVSKGSGFSATIAPSVDSVADVISKGKS